MFLPIGKRAGRSRADSGLLQRGRTAVLGRVDESRDGPATVLDQARSARGRPVHIRREPLEGLTAVDPPPPTLRLFGPPVHAHVAEEVSSLVERLQHGGATFIGIAQPANRPRCPIPSANDMLVLIRLMANSICAGTRCPAWKLLGWTPSPNRSRRCEGGGRSPVAMPPQLKWRARCAHEPR